MLIQIYIFQQKEAKPNQAHDLNVVVRTYYKDVSKIYC